MNKLILLFFAFITISLTLNAQQKLSTINSKKEIAILFIGNSLTYTNNLPKLVKKEAKKNGVKVNTNMVAFPNYAIMDHWIDGKIQNLITSKKYDYVIIQQGPSSQPEGRKILIEYGTKLYELCKKNNTKLSYFMVWPSLKYYHTFDGVIKTYTDAATINNAILIPVGKIWKDYFDKSNNFQYYGPDGFHPSMKGSKIAAKAIVERLIHKEK